MTRAWLAALVVLLAATVAHADPPPIDEDPAAAEASRNAADDDPSFGPIVKIERIDIVGNETTAERLIRRALLIPEGDELRTGDPRFRRSRFRVLALGYFADVQLRLEKGSARGLVVVRVEVEERGTFALDRLFFGGSEATPLWLGLDIHDSNIFGTGLTLGGALVWAAAPDDPDATAQWAVRLRYGDPSVLGTPLGLSAEGLVQQVSEPLPAAGAGGDFQYVNYTRAGGALGLGWDVTRRVRLLGGVRLESIDADTGFDGFFPAGRTLVSALRLGIDRDSRADPVLTRDGTRALAVGEGGAGDYDYFKLQARYERWFPLRGWRHAFSVHLGAGLVVGDPPGFDRFHISEVDRLLPPRPLELPVSTRGPLDLLGRSRTAPLYGDVAGSFEVEYAYRLFRRTHLVYGGDLFVGAGLFGLGSRRDLGDSPSGSYVIDVSFNIGLRVDTEIGVFELSLANALGRIPL